MTLPDRVMLPCEHGHWQNHTHTWSSKTAGGQGLCTSGGRVQVIDLEAARQRMVEWAYEAEGLTDSDTVVREMFAAALGEEQ